MLAFKPKLLKYILNFKKIKQTLYFNFVEALKENLICKKSLIKYQKLWNFKLKKLCKPWAGNLFKTMHQSPAHNRKQVQTVSLFFHQTTSSYRKIQLTQFN